MAQKVKSSRHFLRAALVLVLVVGVFLYMLPLPTLTATAAIKSADPASKLDLPWPKYGQAALGAQGFGVLETHGQQKAVPTASIAKIMTAYSVLKRHPLKPGQQGPKITVTEQDITTYNDYYSKDGSVAKVVLGEKISEYQALQTMLLPSANNIADLLANWSFGSLDKYIAYANAQAKQLGMTHTTIADASGFSPQTLASAQDLVILGEAALKNPVIAQVVAQKQATVPEAGTIHNVNHLLGADNINGIKTGNTDQAGGCYLISSKRSIDGHSVTLIGAVLGAPALSRAAADAKKLITSADSGFKTVTFVKQGQSVGYYQTPWNEKVEAVAKSGLSMFVWQSQTPDISAKLNPLKAAKNKGSAAGSITVRVGPRSLSTNAVLAQKIDKPSWRWRIFER